MLSANPSTFGSPMFRIGRTEPFAASFAAAIRADLMPVAVRDGDDSAIRWDKEQVMATSDTEAAWRRREEVRTQLQRLARRHHPDDRERQAHSADRIDDYHDL